MNTFQKKSKPKRLSLYEMWELHNLLGKSMGKEFLIDEVVEKLKTLPEQNFKSSLRLLYPKHKFENSMQAAVLFIKGLKANRFFEFQLFVESLNARH